LSIDPYINKVALRFCLMTFTFTNMKERKLDFVAIPHDSCINDTQGCIVVQSGDMFGQGDMF